MALAKDRSPPCSFYGSYMLEGVSPSPLQFPSLSNYPFEDDHYQKQLSLQDDSDHCSTNTNIGKAPLSHSPPLSSSSSATSTNGGFAFHGGGSSYHQPEEVHSLINFKSASPTTNTGTTSATYGGGFMHTNGSFLSFQPQSCYNFGLPNENPFLEGQDQLNLKSVVGGGGGGSRVFDEVSGMQTTSGGSYRDAASEWLYGEELVTSETAQESATPQQTSFNKKRPLMEEDSIETLKKQCNSTRKQPNKPKPSNSSKDPQSIAAKNRRERISDRLKVLQDLVPNGSKVDMVSMLEKAISYVKFLQLQVKVLATDEFWPEAGGKAPNIAQVRDAIDAILSSPRDKPSSPN